MADLTDVYAALQKADAAGDTASAKQLADYIRGESSAAAKPTVKSLDSDGQGNLYPTGSAQAKALQSPVSDSPVKSEFEAAGKLLSDWYTGSKQLGSKLLAPIDPKGFGAVNAQANQDAQNARERDAPLMATLPGKVGYFTPSLAMSALPGANTVGGAGLLGSGLGAMSPTVGDESHLKNAAWGGALGLGGKYVGDTLTNWLTPRVISSWAALTGAQKAALAGGESIGMKATPGVQSGSVALQQLESKLDSQPWTSGPFNQLRANNQRVLGKAVAQSIGENSHTVDASVLDSANTRLGNVFESVRDPKRVIYTDPAATKTAIDAIDGDARGLLPGNASVRDNPLVTDLERMTQSGAITGQQLGQLSSKLGKSAYKQMSTPSGDRDWGHALYAAKDHVDDLIQGSLTPAEQAEYAAARGQYRNLMMLTSRTNIVNPSSGEVSGANLANKLQQADKSGFLYGKNQTPMYQAARFAQAFKPVVGNSGTATRLPNFGNLTELPLALAGNLASRAYLSKPGNAIALGLLQGTHAASNAGALLGNRFPQLHGLLQSTLGGGATAPLLPYLEQK